MTAESVLSQGTVLGRRGLRWLMSAGLLLSLGAAAASVAPPAEADDSQVTVDAPAGGSVTVEKTKNLVNEVIRVSWAGFKPSENPLGGQVFSDVETRYPVRVYECRTADPESPKECYGSAIYDYPGRENPYPNQFLGHPDGPFNYLQRATAADESGAVDIEVMTKKESVTLGCTDEVQCSIVVVPNYGDSTRKDSTYPQYPACAVVSSSQAQCLGDGVAGNAIDAPWAWADRVVIPLSFAPSAESCGFDDSAISLLGAPKTERALSSWQLATCLGDAAVSFDYTAQSEALARTAFLTRQADVALTNRPVDAADLPAGSRPFTYAPLTTSAVVVAFRVDDPDTGVPIEQMRLNPRLLAKLVTESYRWMSGANPATDGNPYTLFEDPEFLALNHDVNWPSHLDFGSSLACATPLILADRSDMTYELTRYLAADPDAVAFLDGAADEWGMKLNANFDDMTPYPVDQYELRDPDPAVIRAFQPIQGLKSVARKLVGNAFAGTTNTYVEGPPPTYEKCNGNKGYVEPGARGFEAIIDGANAAAFRFSTAALLNGGGEYVTSTPESLAAAVDDMVVNPDGITRSADFDSSDPAAYPLAMIDYAMVPTGDLAADKAEALGKILDYAAGPGQQTGQLTGGLPLGYLPLTAALSTQTTAAASTVRAQPDAVQATTPPPTTPVPPPPSNGGGGGFVPPVAPTSPGVAPVPTVPAGVPSAAAAGVTATPPAAIGAFKPIASNTPSWVGVVLPLILVAGLAAAALGALGSYVLGRGGVALPRLPWQSTRARRGSRASK